MKKKKEERMPISFEEAEGLARAVIDTLEAHELNELLVAFIVEEITSGRAPIFKEEKRPKLSLVR